MKTIFTNILITFLTVLSLNVYAEGNNKENIVEKASFLQITATQFANKVQQSFSDQKGTAFGEFHNNGTIYLVKFTPKTTKIATKKPADHYLITAYTLLEGKIQQAVNTMGHPYYLYVKDNKETGKFDVLQADWFFPVEDLNGSTQSISYFAPYISFDPVNRNLYNPYGVRIEKKRWSLMLKELPDLKATLKYCEGLKAQGIEDVYVMADQYNGIVKYQIFAGNFIQKTDLVSTKRHLSEEGYSSCKVFDFKYDY